MSGAQEGTRTPTTLRSPAPEAGASTNFATWALITLKLFYIRLSRRPWLQLKFGATVTPNWNKRLCSRSKSVSLVIK